MDSDNKKPVEGVGVNDPTAWETMPSDRKERVGVHRGVSVGESAISDVPVIDNGFEVPKISSQEEIEVPAAQLHARINSQLLEQQTPPIADTPSTAKLEAEVTTTTEPMPTVTAAIPVPSGDWSPTVEPPATTMETKTPQPVEKAPETTTTVVTPAPIKAPVESAMTSQVQAPKVTVVSPAGKAAVKKVNWQRVLSEILVFVIVIVMVGIGLRFWQNRQNQVDDTPQTTPDEAVSAVCPPAVDPVMQANLLLESQRFESEFQPVEINEKHQENFTDFVHHLRLVDTDHCGNLEECIDVFGSEMELPLLWVEQDLVSQAKDGRLEVGVVVNRLYQIFGIERINWAIYPRFSYNEDDNTIQLIAQREEPTLFPFELTWVLVKKDQSEMVLIADSQTDTDCQYRGCPCQPARYYLVLGKSSNGNWVYRKHFVRLLTEGEVTKLAFKFGGQ